MLSAKFLTSDIFELLSLVDDLENVINKNDYKMFSKIINEALYKKKRTSDLIIKNKILKTYYEILLHEQL